ncbi:MAG: ABC transporter ATP-binding protein [Pseudomonadota bacterium]|nr:ABC transporter ATP-binding protein [Pseudomonadota bacterium]
MSAADAIRCQGLVKRYRKARALDGLDLVVPAGSICGLVGPNGAGKTTTMSILAGFLTPDEGSVDLLGLGPFSPETHRGRVGILPQDAELPTASTPRQLLTVWARLQGLDGPSAHRAVGEVLEAVLLSDRADARVGTLSHGMRRRVTVASALLGGPELVMLDEPTSGLDPTQARHLRERIAAEQGRRTVLVSSHNLAELEQICDWVVFIDKGRCTRAGPLATLTGRDREVFVRLAPPYPTGRSEVVTLRVPEGVAPEDATSELLRALLSEGARIAEVRRGESLERRYFADEEVA